MEKRMLVNAREPEESRIAIVEDGALEELYIERQNADEIVGNIYKSKVANVESSLQAAFLEMGWRRHGFLHVSDLSPSCYENGRKGRGRGRDQPPIQDVLRKGQELMVQVTKTGIRNKAPAVTTYVSLPGRYMVLMPQLTSRQGVSRKIDDDGERDRLRDVLDTLETPAGFGVIARTAAEGRTKRELQRDLNSLARLYQDVEQRFQAQDEPALLYEESDLVIRAVRDIFSTDIDEMIVDSEEEYEKILEFMRVTMPSYRRRVKLYTKEEPLFHRQGIAKQIESIHQRRVNLPCGGSIVIEQTEALVAIDVNSGRFKKEKDAEESAFRLNLEAAREIARQIRLRDMGGVIINDFVDLLEEKHRRELERTLWEALKRDRARTKMLRMSKFGIIEMTRQRMRRNLEGSSYEACPTCGGTGMVLTLETMALNTFRRLRAALKNEDVTRAEIVAAPAVAEYLLNHRRRDLSDLEDRLGIAISVEVDTALSLDKAEVTCYTSTDHKIRG